MKKILTILIIFLIANNANAYFYTTLKEDLKPIFDKILAQYSLEDPKVQNSLDKIESYILVRREETYSFLVNKCSKDVNKFCTNVISTSNNQCKCLSENYQELSSLCKFYIKQLFGDPDEIPQKPKVKKIKIN